MSISLKKALSCLAGTVAIGAMATQAARADLVSPPYAVQNLVCAATSGPACQPPPANQDFTSTVKAVGASAPYDDVRHPRSTTEWWYFNLTNPANGSVFINNFEIGPNQIAPNNNSLNPLPGQTLGPDNAIGDIATVWFDANGVAEGCHAQPCSHRNYITHPSQPLYANADPTLPPKVSNSTTGSPAEFMEYVPGSGTISYTSPLNPSHGPYTVSLPAYHVYEVGDRSSCCGLQTFNVDYWLTGIHRGFYLPGITPGGNPNDPFIAWVNPVMDSSVVGFVQPICTSATPTNPADCAFSPPIDLSTWRGYHDHNFGAFDITQQSGWKGYDWGVAHLSGGGGTLFGTATLNLPYLNNGLPATDTDTFGFLMRSDSTGQHFCQTDNTSAGSPTFTQTNGATVGPENYPYPIDTNVTCHYQPSGANASLAYTNPTPVNYHVNDPFLIRGPGFEFTEALGTTSEGGVATGSAALIEHFRNGSNLGCCP